MRWREITQGSEENNSDRLVAPQKGPKEIYSPLPLIHPNLSLWSHGELFLLPPNMWLLEKDKKNRHLQVHHWGSVCKIVIMCQQWEHWEEGARRGKKAGEYGGGQS